MTILRRAFGFSPETEEEEGEYDPTVPTYAVSNQSVATSGTDSNAAAQQEQTARESAPADSEAASETESAAEADAKLTDDLFDAVIDLFNRTQPEFVRECLNVDAQRRYILNSLSESLRQRVDSALSADNRKWEQEKEALLKKINELEGDDNELSRLRKENRRLQLSVDRQKRALLDRINDLETQLTKQAQEKERFFSRKHQPQDSEELAKATARLKELESETESLKTRNSELETRLKETEDEKSALASAIEAAATAKKDETAPEATDSTGSEDAGRISDLETRLAESAARLTEAESKLAEAETRLSETQSALTEAETQKSALTAERESMAAECERLREETARQSTLREQLEVKTSMSDAMINDLRNQAASARNELERMQQEQEAVVSQIQQQLDGFEDLKARKDAKISELQESNASLRRTIETNLYNQANSEMKLRSEIKSLKAELAGRSEKAEEQPRSFSTGPVNLPSPTPESVRPAAERQTKRRGRPKKVRIDSDLDNTDWFAGNSKHDDPDFGYHEPPRKPVNDNEAQLSLF